VISFHSHKKGINFCSIQLSFFSKTLFKTVLNKIKFCFSKTFVFVFFHFESVSSFQELGPQLAQSKRIESHD